LETVLASKVTTRLFWNVFFFFCLLYDPQMLLDSFWNSNPNIVTSDCETIVADYGYFSTEYINITKPFTEADLLSNQDNKYFNK